MRGLIRNTRPLSYALYLGETEIVDHNGNKTGDFESSYSEPVTVRMNIAPAKGDADWNPFGIDTPYTLAAMTFDLNSPITETSIVWVDKSTDEPHNYVVTRVAKSVNNIVYALLEVENGETGSSSQT